MRIPVRLIALLPLSLLFFSCMSTRVYVKETAQMYENDLLLEETTSLTRDDKLLETSGANYHATSMDGFQVLARTESDPKKDYQTMHLQLFSGDSLYAEDDYRVRDGGALTSGTMTTDSSGQTVDTLPADVRSQLQKALKQVLSEQAAAGDSDIAGGQLQMLTTAEQVQVDSTPNGSYIFYNIVGKPFVIVGVSAWNIVKCAGYAFINFAGGYNTVVNGHFFWKMPDVKKAKAKAAAARAANGISAYPEYHLPFTNNHITVTATTSETTNVFSESEKQVKVLSNETYEYDNTISVERSASADANSTASVIGMVGTIITVPVSVITWIGGAAFGIYAQTQN